MLSRSMPIVGLGKLTSRIAWALLVVGVLKQGLLQHTWRLLARTSLPEQRRTHPRLRLAHKSKISAPKEQNGSTLLWCEPRCHSVTIQRLFRHYSGTLFSLCILDLVFSFCPVGCGTWPRSGGLTCLFCGTPFGRLSGARETCHPKMFEVHRFPEERAISREQAGKD